MHGLVLQMSSAIYSCLQACDKTTSWCRKVQTAGCPTEKSPHHTGTGGYREIRPAYRSDKGSFAQAGSQIVRFSTRLRLMPSYLDIFTFDRETAVLTH